MFGDRGSYTPWGNVDKKFCKVPIQLSLEVQADSLFSGGHCFREALSHGMVGNWNDSSGSFFWQRSICLAIVKRACWQMCDFATCNAWDDTALYAFFGGRVSATEDQPPRPWLPPSWCIGCGRGKNLKQRSCIPGRVSPGPSINGDLGGSTSLLHLDRCRCWL